MIPLSNSSLNARFVESLFSISSILFLAFVFLSRGGKAAMTVNALCPLLALMLRPIRSQRIEEENS
jgi:hypothetical protein